MHYKAQIQNILKCGDVNTLKRVELLEYEDNDLIKIFNEYNICKDPSYEIVSKQDNKKHDYNLNIKLGVNSIKFETENNPIIAFDPKPTFYFAIENELIFPFNKNKWSAFIELGYLNYKTSKTTRVTEFTQLDSSIEYSSIEALIGIRHYMFISNDLKGFLNFAYNHNFALESKYFRTKSSREEKLRPNTNFSVGSGLQFKKYRLEARYNASRNLRFFRGSGSKFNSVSLLLAYELF